MSLDGNSNCTDSAELLAYEVGRIVIKHALSRSLIPSLVSSRVDLRKRCSNDLSRA